MQRELLLLREMRDAATAIRELVDGRSSEQVGADGIRRSALWHFTVLGEAASQVRLKDEGCEPRSRGVLPPGCATASSTATGTSTWNWSRPVDDLPDMITNSSAIASLQEPEGTDPAL